MTLKDKITSDMTAAMKAKDAARTSALRMVKAAIMHREKEGTGELSDDDVLKLLHSQVKQRRDSVNSIRRPAARIWLTRKSLKLQSSNFICRRARLKRRSNRRLPMQLAKPALRR